MDDLEGRLPESDEREDATQLEETEHMEVLPTEEPALEEAELASAVNKDEMPRNFTFWDWESWGLALLVLFLLVLLMWGIWPFLIILAAWFLL